VRPLAEVRPVLPDRQPARRAHLVCSEAARFPGSAAAATAGCSVEAQVAAPRFPGSVATVLFPGSPETVAVCSVCSVAAVAAVSRKVQAARVE
jgi:hypothetical protein